MWCFLLVIFWGWGSGIARANVGPMSIKKSLNLLGMIFLSVTTSSFPIRNLVWMAPFFVYIYYIFNQTRWPFHVIFIFQNKIKVILLFSPFHQMLQFALVLLVVFFIKRWFYSFTFSIQFIFISYRIFQSLRQLGFPVAVFSLFTFTFGKCLLNRANSWLWNKSNTPSVSEALYMSVGCTKSWMKWIFIRWSK